MIHSLGPPYSNWSTFYYVLSNRRNVKYYIYYNSSYNKILQKKEKEIYTPSYNTLFHFYYTYDSNSLNSLLLELEYFSLYLVSTKV